MSSCQKSVLEYSLQNNGFAGPDTTWAGTISADLPVATLRAHLLLPPREDAVNIVSGTLLHYVSPEGIEVNIPANALRTITGAIPQNSIFIRTRLLRKKGEIIRSGFPTVSDGLHLQTAGEVLVSARKDSAELLLAPATRISINISPNNTTGDLKLYHLTGLSPSLSNWTLNADTAYNKVVRSGNGLEILSTHFGWLNAGRPAGNSTPTVRLSPVLPSNYTNANTMVFVCFNNQVTVSVMEPVVSGKIFQSLPLVPGTEVTVIVLSRQVEDYYFASSIVTTGNGNINGEPQKVVMTPIKTNLDAIKQYLDNL